MANRRISELQEIAGLTLADADLFTVVQTAEVDPAIKNKKLTISGTKAYLNVYYLPRTGGTISGNVIIQDDLTVSGQTSLDTLTTTGTSTIKNLIVNTNATITGTISGITITGTYIKGTEITGQTISGVTVTGTHGKFTNLTATNITGTTFTGTTANFTTVNAVDLNVTDDVVVRDDLTVTGIIEGKDIIKGVTVTGTTKVLAPLITGATVVGTTKVSGATVTGTAGQFTNLTATNITGTTLITGVTIKMSGDTVSTQSYAVDNSIVFAIALG